jgi:hypothetical protein
MVLAKEIARELIQSAGCDTDTQSPSEFDALSVNIDENANVYLRFYGRICGITLNSTADSSGCAAVTSRVSR